MGVEFRILRTDNKTIFDVGKHLGDDELLEVIFSQEELLEYLTLWVVNFCNDNFNSIGALIIRDRLLDFTEGSKINNLKVVGDTWWDGEVPECKEYTFTHDRYFCKEDVENYKNALLKIQIKQYTKNPLEFFRKGNFSKGLCLNELNERRDRWRSYSHI